MKRHAHPAKGALTAAPWQAECLGGPWDGQRQPVYLDRTGDLAVVTLEPPDTTGIYHLTLNWRTGRAAWGWHE
jgi:hypothetical protein